MKPSNLRDREYLPCFYKWGGCEGGRISFLLPLEAGSPTFSVISAVLNLIELLAQMWTLPSFQQLIHCYDFSNSASTVSREKYHLVGKEETGIEEHGHGCPL